MLQRDSGNVNLTAIALILGTVITSVWVWKRLSLDTQDYIIDQAIPLVAIGLAVLTLLVLLWRAFRRRRSNRQERDRLLKLFEKETKREKQLELAFAMIEVNGYRIEGLESAVPLLRDLFVTTMQRAVGDKQHRIRGMAASHLGVLQDKSVVPLLVKALEDDHAYVRSCAALALGRLRATETKERLMTVMKDDWDQTVRSRAKEALERMRA
ncbi:MAG TPA: HEAT repeat domain-containing protein [Nitrospira sp.]|nr:HEAT repeat domain-containing protein [Nitrospira sp.]